MGFPGSSAGKESTCNAGDPALIPGLEKSLDPLEEGVATHSSILVWRILWTQTGSGREALASTHGGGRRTGCRRRPGARKKNTGNMARPSGKPAWDPTCVWVAVGSHLSRQEIPWRRKWQPTPVFLSGKSHGQRSLVGYSPWGHKSQTRPSD